jgi:hypothetical protein
MQDFRHVQEAMVQAGNRVLAHQSYTLLQQEQLQLARRSPLWGEGSVTTSMSPLTHAHRQRTLRHWNMSLPYHHSATGAHTQQLYPADGAQQGPSAMPPSLRGGGSCTPSVVQSQGYADHVVRETTKQALFQSILKKQALKQEVERLVESNRQLADAHAAMEDSTRPGSTPRAVDRSALVSLYQKKNVSTSVRSLPVRTQRPFLHESPIKRLSVP